MTLEQKRQMNTYGKMLDNLGDKGLLALDEVSNANVQRKLDAFFQSLCDACEGDPDIEAEFGELAHSLDEVTTFLRRHPSVLKKL